MYFISKMKGAFRWMKGAVAYTNVLWIW